MKTKYTKLIYTSLLVAILLAVACCARHGKAWNDMDRAESLMASKPDSALSVLESIAPSDLTGKEGEARYALLMSMALDKNYVDTTTFSILQPAIDYYLQHGTPDEKLRTLYYQGRIYQNQGEKVSAMQCFNRTSEYIAFASDTLIMAHLLVSQATILYTFQEYDDFIDNNLKAANLYNAINRPDFEASCLINAIDGSIINNNKDLADSLFSKVKELEEYIPDIDTHLRPYSLSYAVNFESKERIGEIVNTLNAMPYLDDTSRLDMAMAYYKLGDRENATHYFRSILPSSPITSSLKYLSTKPCILEIDGQMHEALNAQRYLSSHLDSIHKEVSSNALLLIDDAHKFEISNLKELHNKERIILIGIGVIAVLLYSAYRIFKKLKISRAKNVLDAKENNRLKLEQESLKKDNKKLEQATANAEFRYRQQAQTAENLKLELEKTEAEIIRLKTILNEISDFPQPVKDAIKVRIEMLNALLATHITDDESYSKLYDEWCEKLVKDKDEFMNSTRLAFKVSHPKFIEYLEERGLTEAEINYACLYAIGLRGKEVGNYMQLRRHYHISSDIRKKLGIDQHQTNIGIYIRKLLKNL